MPIYRSQGQQGGSDPNSVFLNKLAVKSHFNLDQDFIVTTEDKIRLCLANEIKKKSDWIGPGGITITLITVLSTTEFKPGVPFGKDVATAVAIVITTVFTLMTAKAFWDSFSARSLDEVVTALKKGARRPDDPDGAGA